MITITIYHKNASDITDIVYELEDAGWLRNQDFDFAYYPTKYDPRDFYEVTPMHTDFMFYTESAATFFQLKYGN